MIPDSWKNSGAPNTTRRIGLGIEAHGVLETQERDAGQRAGKNEALRPVLRKGESEGRNGKAG